MKPRIVKHATKHAKETARVAKELAQVVLKGGMRQHAVVIGLSGELGAGKTMFAKAFAKELGVEEAVVSPTFILERIYLLPKTKKNKKMPFSHLVHIDAYRLGIDEMKHLGWDELVSDANNIMIVEWAEKIKKLLPQDAIKIYFEHKGKEMREISMMKHKT